MKQVITDRTLAGEFNFLFCSVACISKGLHDLRDYITGAFDEYLIAQPQIFFPDVFFVVNGDAADGDATDGHWFEFSHGGNGTRSTNLKFDGQQFGGGLSRLEFKGDGPSGMV